MSNRTGRRRRTIPGYVSIEIASFRSIAASFKNDAEFGRWVKKAFDDMSIGCVLDDTDPRIRAIYTEAFDRMEYEYKRKKEWEERKNKENAETEKIDEPKPLPRSNNETKTPDQLVWGQFENVFLTQEQFNELARNVGNLNKARELVENLSAGLADGSKESKNHFATLTHWANYRKSKAEEDENSGTRYETVTEHNRRVSEKADREIRQMKEMGLI